MNPIQHMHLHENEFTKSELKIMKYLTMHLDIISSHPIQTVAERCKVSKSALLRFCQKCGYRGYSEFKYEISRYLQSIITTDYTQNNSAEVLINSYTEQIKHLLNPNITETFQQLSVLIEKANKIKLYGIHETGLSAQYFSYRLGALGIDSEAIVDTSVMSAKASFAKENDLNIFLSLSAKTTTICDALNYSIENNVHNVLITQNDHHKFKNKIDLSIILPTFNYEDKRLFLDAQALMIISIDLFIHHLAKHLKNN